MTRDEAVRILQEFGEGIPGHRDRFNDEPTHGDWHAAVAVLTGVPWHPTDAASHVAHHRDVIRALGLAEPASDVGHAEHSTAVMVAIARTLTDA